jgi:hypothetical protein
METSDIMDFIKDKPKCDIALDSLRRIEIFDSNSDYIGFCFVGAFFYSKS